MTKHIHIKIDGKLKEQFAKACKSQDSNVTNVIQSLIKEYIEEPRQVKLTPKHNK